MPRLSRTGAFWLLALAWLTRPLMASGTESCRPPFVAMQSLAVPNGVYAVHNADINVDGRPDLVAITGYGLPAISVRLAQSDGTLGPAIDTPTGFAGFTSASAVGLFTNDLVPDVVIAGPTIRLFKGNGDGTFQAPTTIAPGAYSWVQGADVNFDGKLDLVVTSQPEGNLLTFLGNGDGTFQAPTTLPMVTPITTFAAGDLNGDGFADVIAAFSDPTLEVFLSNGDGTYAPPMDVSVGVPWTITLSDVTSDGVLDLLVVANSRVAVLVGNGDGSFQAGLLFDAGRTPYEIVAGDFDGDGLADLAVSNGQLGAVWLLRGLGTGEFVSLGGFAVDLGGDFITAADFTGDGNLDLAAGSNFQAVVTLLRGLGDGRLEAPRVSDAYQYMQFGAQGDFDEDGVPDLATQGYDGELRLFLGNGDGTFSAGATDLTAAPVPAGVLAADLNEDGHLDVALLSRPFHRILLYFGHGNGTFDPPVAIGIQDDASEADFFTVGHFTGGAHLDFLVIDEIFQSSGQIAVLPGHGDGTFDTPIVTTITNPSTAGLAADLDGDGFEDLVLGNYDVSFQIGVFLNLGDGTFGTPDLYPYGHVARPPILAALHTGGPPDLVIPSLDASFLEIFPGAGDGTFGAPSTVFLDSPPLSVAAADFDEDGNVDLVTANQQTSVLFGLGDGLFLPAAVYEIGHGGQWVWTGDYDDNGRADAAFLSSDGLSTINVLLNGVLSAKVRDASLVVGSAAQLSAHASGFGPLSYQWRKGGVPLSDGGTISGATTATLTIDPVAFTDAGSYDVLVSDSCGSASSNAATLSVDFDDVPLTNPFHDDILTIATSGITAGCTDTSFCPSHDVSRAEMAVFLLKAKFGADHVPPAPPPIPIFPDVPADAFAAAWIDELAGLGITTGCGGGLYCPDRPVSRAEMAVFLLKTLLGSGYAPPAAVGLFADVPAGYFAIDWIEDLYNRGITAGCGTSPLRYCPDADVPREQMATFLVRTFLLP